MPKVILLGRKPGAVVALEHLLSRDWDVVCVVAPSIEENWTPGPRLADVAAEAGIPVCPYQEILRRIQNPGNDELAEEMMAVEWVFSYLFPCKVPRSLLGLPNMGALNFHPAPLPEYGGLGGYNFAILEQRHDFGVTCHYMDEGFDTGDIIKVETFPIDPDRETAQSLEARAQRALIRLFVDITGQIEHDGPLQRIPQGGQTRYIDRVEFEAAKTVTLTDDPVLTERRARAFWYPPHEGARIEVGGRHYTLVPLHVLGMLGQQAHQNDLEGLRQYYKQALSDS